ncbi:hypothetical protein IFM89_005206 [Coptis chinensis]|uniref:Protein kinase domain-containing protein n=1 Tax=Coptis chinensis TaxID=261450 RepID=A0A835HYJ1_9MAGN|nr:hypothetical protein IFM89_005206 [Coptis chinensis]
MGCKSRWPTSHCLWDTKLCCSRGYDGTTADIWSCGVILFVLMARYLPFDESNLISLYRKINKADFTCPSWFSSSAKNLIKRILDPNPLTRITIPDILENEWFKKGYRPPDFEQGEDVSLDDVVAVFNDSKVSVTIDGCQEKILPFSGRSGLYIEGSVSPPISGVDIRVVTADNSGDMLLCRKLGYHLKSIGSSSFSCQKLSQIAICIYPREESSELFPSILLSLSGEDGYR